MKKLKKRTKRAIAWTVSIIVIAAAIWGLAAWQRQPSIPQTAMDEFAQCLSDQNATFYGAFWCPHCETQREMFGSSVEFVPYVECSTPDGRGQLTVCQQAGIESYPTWEFADGSRVTGTQDLQTLAQRTGCELPQ